MDKGRPLPVGSHKRTTTKPSSLQETDSPLIVDELYEDFKIQAFLEKRHKYQEEIRKNIPGVNHSWFDCCICGHHLQHPETTCSKCPHECCDDCYASQPRLNDMPLKDSAIRIYLLLGKLFAAKMYASLFVGCCCGAVLIEDRQTDRILDHQVVTWRDSLDSLRALSAESFQVRNTSLKTLSKLEQGISVSTGLIVVAYNDLKTEFETFWDHMGVFEGKSQDGLCDQIFFEMMQSHDNTIVLVRALEEVKDAIATASGTLGTSTYEETLSSIQDGVTNIVQCVIDARKDITPLAQETLLGMVENLRRRTGENFVYLSSIIQNLETGSGGMV
jgi:hypothetical protein